MLWHRVSLCWTLNIIWYGYRAFCALCSDCVLSKCFLFIGSFSKGDWIALWIIKFMCLYLRQCCPWALRSWFQPCHLHSETISNCVTFVHLQYFMFHFKSFYCHILKVCIPHWTVLHKSHRSVSLWVLSPWDDILSISVFWWAWNGPGCCYVIC